MKESAVEKSFQSVHTGIVGLKSGTHGLWQGPLEETVVGVLLDPTRSQRFKEKHYGHVPFGLPEDATEWTLIEKFTTEQYSYVAEGNIIFLIIN